MVHTWKIYDLKRTIADGVVSEVIYACESELEGTSTRKIGTFNVTGSTSDEGFVAYEDLTEEVVLEWLNSNVIKATIQEANEAEITGMKAAEEAITETQGKPW